MFTRKRTKKRNRKKDMAIIDRPYLQHLFSSATTENGPKQPLPDGILVGEIAVNYNSDEPALFIKDSDGEIVKFNAVHRDEIDAIERDIENVPFEQGDGLNSAVQKQAQTVIDATGLTSQSIVISESAISEGAGNIVGAKGYAWTDIDFTGKTITLALGAGEDQPDSWAVNDTIAIINGEKYGNITITEINGNVIKVNSIPFNEISDRQGYGYHVVVNVGRLDKGNVDVGVGAHAEGLENQALTIGSHAEGRRTVAFGYQSHSEGLETSADGDASHSEGRMTIAHGTYSHSEGCLTLADGESSHAEGESTRAMDLDTHAEGFGTTASTQYAHSEGYETLASGQGSHTEGYHTTASTFYAHAEGEGSQAKGRNSHSEGEMGIAYERGCHVEGKLTKAYGMYSHAEGSETEAGFIDPLLNKTWGDQAVHVEGYRTKAVDRYTHAEGYNTYAGYNPSFERPLVNDPESPVYETPNFDASSAAHAEGYQTRAYGFASHSEGRNTEANHLQSHAEGEDTIASNRDTHAEGRETNATGENAHSEGYLTMANGNSSHSEGKKTLAYGDQSHSEGIGDVTRPSYTVNGSADTTTYTTSAAHTLKVGSIIKYGTKYRRITAVPNTTSFTVDQSFGGQLSGATIEVIKGIAYKVGAHSEGVRTIAGGPGAHAEGADTIAIDERAHAEGQETSAIGKCSHAEGARTIAGGDCSHAEGADNKANGNRAHAEGDHTTASGNYSHTEGSGTTATNQFEHAGGCNNISHNGSQNKDKTIRSVGIGTADNARANAVEIMQNGDSYLYGVGGYDGKNYSTASTIQDVVRGIDGSISALTEDSVFEKGIGTKSIQVKGLGSVAFGNNSYAEGYRTYAYGTESHTEGRSINVVPSQTDFTSDDDIINKWGSIKFTLAKGIGSHAEGNSTLSLGNASHAEGYQNIARGGGSHVGGTTSKSIGKYSFAHGNLATANGDKSVAMGAAVLTTTECEIAFGKYNTSHSGVTRFSVGIGTADNARANAVEIMQNGDAYLYGVGGYSGTTYSGKTTIQTILNNAITKAVNDLTNYYLKSETYTKTEVNNLIGAIDQFHYEIYQSISGVTDPQGNVLYLIGPTGSLSDKYEEYVYANNQFVKIGDTTIDLSGYVTYEALNAAEATDNDIDALFNNI